MENIEIVLVTPKDVLQLQYIGKETFSQAFSDINTEENMKKYLNKSFSIEQLNEELNNELSQFYFAILDNEVIGYMKLNRGEAQKENQNDNALEIERIYVLQNFLGKNVGQRLYFKAIQVAEEMSVNYVWLGVWEKNFRAIAFYKKNGFIPFDQHIFMLGDDRQLDILMKLKLSKENK